MPTKSALDPREVLGLPPEALPRHIAIIMDGNGRWARQRDLPRIEGHRNGAEAVGAVVEECARLGVECLTLYSFSQENWKRPRAEVKGLMQFLRSVLYSEYLELKRRAMDERIAAFEAKWDMSFDEFSRKCAEGTLAGDAYSYEVEKDFWEWGQAVTLQDHYESLRLRWM